MVDFVAGHRVETGAAGDFPRAPELLWNRARVYAIATGEPRDCELVDARELVASGSYVWESPEWERRAAAR